MSSPLRKLGANFGPRAIGVLGLPQYLRMVALTVSVLPAFLRSRDLRQLDRVMGRRPITVRFLGRRFVIDCPAVDAVIEDGTYTFGLIRELFIRNCYARGGIRERLEAAETVLDLGANRGLFSVMAATTARQVIAVELYPQFREAIRANMAASGLDNVNIVSTFIGAGGADADNAVTTTTLPELLDEAGIARVDLIKMDIEGSEYELFREPQWLERCGAICMEVHPEYGRVADIVKTLETHGFTCRVADHLFREVTDVQRGEFIWAVAG